MSAGPESWVPSVSCLCDSLRGLVFEPGRGMLPYTSVLTIKDRSSLRHCFQYLSSSPVKIITVENLILHLRPMAWWKNLLVNFLKSSWFLQPPSIISITWKKIFLKWRVLQWQEASQRSSGSWQLSLRDGAVCTPCVLTRGQYVGSGILWGCSLYPLLASSAFCLPELSKVRPLWEILVLLIILQAGSRHISEGMQ